YNSTTVGLAATLHVSAVIPNFLITEYFVNFEPRGADVALNPFRVEQGYVTVPTAPGLGIELREDALARYAHRECSARTTPTPGDEGPWAGAGDRRGDPACRSDGSASLKPRCQFPLV